jgi:hypothetical protein
MKGLGIGQIGGANGLKQEYGQEESEAERLEHVLFSFHTNVSIT